MSCKVSLELVRLRRLAQEHDAPLLTSASAEVVVVDPGDGGAVLASHVTRVVPETADPFFNDVIAVDATTLFLDAFERAPPAAVAKPRPPPAARAPRGGPPRRSVTGPLAREGRPRPRVECCVEVVVRVRDHNQAPPLLIASGSGAVPAGEAAKGELVVPLIHRADSAGPAEAGPGPCDAGAAGAAVFRYVVKVARPHATVNDADADVVVKDAPRLHGGCPLIPPGRPLPTVFLWWHFLFDPAWRDRLHAAVTLSYGQVALQQALEQRTSAGDGRRRGSSTALQQRALVAEVQAGLEPLTLPKVATQHWAVRRSHQLFAKLRWTAERFMLGATGPELVLPPGGGEEDKLQWKGHALMRAASIAQSPPVERVVDQLWALYLCGDCPPRPDGPDGPDGPESPFALQHHHRAAMTTAVFARAHCEALQASLIATFDPVLRPTDIPALLARADFEVDVLVNPAAAAAVQRSTERRESLVGRGPAAPTSPTSPTSPASPASPAAAAASPTTSGPGQQARAWFEHVLLGFAGRWCDGFAEAEYAELLRALAPAVVSAREKAAHLASVAKAGGAAGGDGGKAAKKSRKAKASRDPAPSGTRVM